MAVPVFKSQTRRRGAAPAAGLLLPAAAASVLLLLLVVPFCFCGSGDAARLRVVSPKAAASFDKAADDGLQQHYDIVAGLELDSGDGGDGGVKNIMDNRSNDEINSVIGAADGGRHRQLLQGDGVDGAVVGSISGSGTAAGVGGGGNIDSGLGGSSVATGTGGRRRRDLQDYHHNDYHNWG